MRIDVRDNKDYDTGIHPEVTVIVTYGRELGNFFGENRFPNLVELDYGCRGIKSLRVVCPSLQVLWCTEGDLTELELNCPSLRELYCYHNRLTELKLNSLSLLELNCGCNQLTKLELDCPSLQRLLCISNQLTKLELNCPSLRRLLCNNNQLTKLELDCPSLQDLYCQLNQLTDLDGLEFCAELCNLTCSKTLEGSVKILKIHLPDLVVEYL